MSFERGDEVAAATDLGGFWKGQIPAGTPGVVDNVESGDSSAPLYTVTFMIEHDDFLVPHHTTVTQLSDSQLIHAWVPGAHD
jgi:hypothetical protein